MSATRWAMTAATAALGLTAAGRAGAQPPTDVEARGRPASGFGVELLVGGGYSDFTGSTARALTGGGAGTWDARMVLGSRRRIGFEAAYVGSQQSLHLNGVSSNVYLLGNSGEGSLRLAMPVARATWLVAPFLTAGVGWNYYMLQAVPFDVSNLRTRDTNLTVPIAAGIDAVYHRFAVRLRGLFRPTFYDNLFGNVSLTTWGVSGSLGVEF